MADTLAPVSAERLRQLLDRMTTTRIAVVGDVMLDRYITGDVERISPEAPVPIVTVDTERDAAGGAANAAVNVVTAGAVALLAGIVGDDAAGTTLKAVVGAQGIATDGLVTVAGRTTTSKTRLIARGQQVVRIDSEVTNPLADRDRERFAAVAAACLAGAGVLLIEDYDKGAVDAALAGELVAKARDRNVPVVVDPKNRNFFAYSGATVFKPNRAELSTAFGTRMSGDDDDLESIRRRVGAEHLLLTLGSDGVVLVSPDASPRRASGAAREVYDVSGAGDTVAAWVALTLAAGGTVAEGGWIANIAAGVKVGKRGASPVTPTELLAALD